MPYLRALCLSTRRTDLHAALFTPRIQLCDPLLCKVLALTTYFSFAVVTLNRLNFRFQVESDHLNT